MVKACVLTTFISLSVSDVHTRDLWYAQSEWPWRSFGYVCYVQEWNDVLKLPIRSNQIISWKRFKS